MTAVGNRVCRPTFGNVSRTNFRPLTPGSIHKSTWLNPILLDLATEACRDSFRGEFLMTIIMRATRALLTFERYSTHTGNTPEKVGACHTLITLISMLKLYRTIAHKSPEQMSSSPRMTCTILRTTLASTYLPKQVCNSEGGKTMVFGVTSLSLTGA